MSQKDIKIPAEKRDRRVISVTYYEKPSGGHKDVLGCTNCEVAGIIAAKVGA
jgi:hypothetical protein